MPPVRPRAKIAAYFDTSRYLDRADLRLRSAAVRALLGDVRGAALADLGCGDGTLSLPFLHGDNRLTLVDVSRAMVARARRRVPAARAGQVTFREGDFLELSFPEPFDVVLCVGVLAHLERPADGLARIAALLKPGAVAVVQYTDHASPWSIPGRLWRAARETVRPTYGYRLARTTRREILRAADAAGLRLEAEIRHHTVPPLVRRLVRGEVAYRLERAAARNAWLARTGPEIVARLRKSPAASARPGL